MDIIDLIKKSIETKIGLLNRSQIQSIKSAGEEIVNSFNLPDD